MSIKSSIKKTAIYRYYREYRILHNQRLLFYAEAQKRFQKEKPAHGSLEDYKSALYKHRVSYDEYMYRYDFWKLNESERNEFIAEKTMEMLYRNMVKPEVRQMFCDKAKFLHVYKDYIHRKWIFVKDSTFEEFSAMVQQYDCIAKPLNKYSGEGIFKIKRDEDRDLNDLFLQLKRDSYLVEECIYACDEIAEFHPWSLNTIRVVTMSNNGQVRFIGAILRMGAHGSYIDNTHAGGVFASIDIDTGIIESDGVDTDGNIYIVHPDTKKQIKGFKIPEWEKIKSLCAEATTVFPNIYFAGWDLCVTRDGHVEIIEGNFAPHFDGGMQVPMKRGAKRKVSDALVELFHKKPLL